MALLYTFTYIWKNLVFIKVPLTKVDRGEKKKILVSVFTMFFWMTTHTIYYTSETDISITLCAIHGG